MQGQRAHLKAGRSYICNLKDRGRAPFGVPKQWPCACHFLPHPQLHIFSNHQPDLVIKMSKQSNNTFSMASKPKRTKAISAIEEIVKKEGKVQFNNLCQRQRREILAIKAEKDLSEAEKAEAIADIKERIIVEKGRVKLQHQIMLDHGLTEETYGDARKLRAFKKKLLSEHTKEERAQLADLREGRGLEGLDYGSDVDLDEGMADKEQYDSVQDAMKDFLSNMDEMLKEHAGEIEEEEEAEGNGEEEEEEELGSEDDEDDDSEEESEDGDDENGDEEDDE